MFYLVELAIESSACVAVAHEDYAAEGLADSHSSFQLNEEFEAEIENDDFEFDDSAADAVRCSYQLTSVCSSSCFSADLGWL